jgi:hypothetical protein
MNIFLKGLLKDKYFITFIIFTIIVPAIASGIVSINNFMWFDMVKSNDWIGFIGSYLGAIIGGLFTLLGVLLTLKNQQEQNEELANIQKEQENNLFMYQFENTLFRLISFQKDSTKEMKIEVDVNEYFQGFPAFEWVSKEATSLYNEIIDNEFKDFDIEINIHIEYFVINTVFKELYSKYQNSLAHYYRSLLHILKSINNTIQDPHLKEKYISILRSQISQEELKLIYYFSISLDELNELMLVVKESAFFNTTDKTILINPTHYKFLINNNEFKNYNYDEIDIFLG